MTDRTTLRQVGRWVLLLMVANVVSTGIFVYAAFRSSEEARRHNCQQVVDAFDDYTNALAEVSHADPARLEQFRATYQPLLQDCH